MSKNKWNVWLLKWNWGDKTHIDRSCYRDLADTQVPWHVQPLWDLSRDKIQETSDIRLQFPAQPGILLALNISWFDTELSIETQPPVHWRREKRKRKKEREKCHSKIKSVSINYISIYYYSHWNKEIVPKEKSTLLLDSLRINLYWILLITSEMYSILPKILGIFLSFLS